MRHKQVPETTRALHILRPQLLESHVNAALVSFERQRQFASTTGEYEQDNLN